MGIALTARVPGRTITKQFIHPHTPQRPHSLRLWGFAHAQSVNSVLFSNTFSHDALAIAV